MNHSITGLTSQLHKVFLLWADGMTAKEISRELFVSVRTAENYLRDVKLNMGLFTRYEANTYIRKKRLTTKIYNDKKQAMNSKFIMILCGLLLAFSFLIVACSPRQDVSIQSIVDQSVLLPSNLILWEADCANVAWTVKQIPLENGGNKVICMLELKPVPTIEPTMTITVTPTPTPTVTVTATPTVTVTPTRGN